ncbi:ecto-NOX disulfide-thiol exchanger 2-like [Pecten maximus]|uniref:ecto-NOX disulfide-thiol exchanger 2-like n=1 Tax=Pecten maximus TaxID=6579 RepID=UPI0014584FE2|nr:ecto-NOX disulfide-thiol exchanger 2-like [Pecten maximus]
MAMKNYNNNQQAMIGPQMPSNRMDPNTNNAPLSFNMNKGRPPMGIMMDGNRNDPSGASPSGGMMGGSDGGNNNNNMMMGSQGYYGPMGNMMQNPMMGPDPNMMMMFNQYGGWGPMGPGGPGMGPGGPMMGGPGSEFMPKEIMTLKSSVLYPPPQNAPPQTTRERPMGCRTIFVGGLPENVTEEMIAEIFENFGNIVSIRKGKKNFAHIRYEMEDSVERSMFVSGYRMKIEDKDDKPNTGRLHVDYAQARDDQYEFECKQRAVIREMRHYQRIEEDRLRPPSPPPVIHYSDHESLTLLEKLKSDAEYQMANNVVITWLERGDLTKRNVANFYSLIQCTNSQVRKLLGEKNEAEQDVQRAKQKFQTAFEGIIQQFDQIERVFSSALKQRNWDHFSKAQRKNIELWHKQLQEIKKQQQEEFLGSREEDDMEMSDNDEVCDPSTAKKKKMDDQIAASTLHIQENQLTFLREDNEALKRQVEAFQNETHLIRQENKDALHEKENQMKMLQTVLQGMQQQLIQTRMKIKELEKYKALASKSGSSSGEKSKEKAAEKSGDKESTEDKDSTEDQTETEEDTTEQVTTEDSEETKAEKVPVTDIPFLNLSSLTSSGNSLNITEKEAKLIGLICCFLHVHPNGASVDYIWSYLHQLGVSSRTSELEDLMERLPVLFKLVMSGVGATIEKRWQFLGYQSTTVPFLSV